MYRAAIGLAFLSSALSSALAQQVGPDTQPSLGLGHATGAPGQSGILLPVSISFTDGYINGWTALLSYDPAVLAITSFESVKQADVEFLDGPEEFNDPGVVRVAVGYSRDTDPARMLPPGTAILVAKVTLCILPEAPQGIHTVEVLPSARAENGTVLETNYLWYDQALNQPYNGYPALSDGTVSVSGTPVSPSNCHRQEPPPPVPPPEIRYELDGPATVVVGSDFSLAFRVTSEVALLGLGCAITFDRNVLSLKDVTLNPALTSTATAADLVSSSDSGIGMVVGPGYDRPMSPGTHLVGTISFAVARQPTTGLTEVNFSRIPLNLTVENPDGEVVVIPFRNIAVEHRADGSASDGLEPEDLEGAGALAVTQAFAAALNVGARAFRRGDADQDGSVQLTDAITVLNYLFLGGMEPRCLDAADADDSGRLNLTDPITILNFLFLGVTSLPNPGAVEPGEDPTGDELDCVGPRPN